MDPYSIYEPEYLPILWFHIPCIIIVYCTSDGPQDEVSNYLGPCSSRYGELSGFLLRSSMAWK